MPPTPTATASKKSSIDWYKQHTEAIIFIPTGWEFWDQGRLCELSFSELITEEEFLNRRDKSICLFQHA